MTEPVTSPRAPSEEGQGLAARAPSSRRAWAPLVMGLLIPVGFFIAGLLTLQDYGTTWDEAESYEAGEGNLRLLRSALSGGKVEWPWHELRGYQFVFDTYRGAVARIANAVAFEPGSFLGFRVANLVLGSAALGLLYFLALEVGAGPRVAAASALALALSPKYLAHSQNNPKDLIGLFVIVVGVLVIVRAARSGAWRWYLLAGALLGLAVANHVAAVVLLPLAGVWVMMMGRGSLAARALRLASLVAVVPAATFLSWPWLWGDPLPRLAQIASRISGFPVNMEVLYLGRLYHAGEVPWHYSLVSLAVATPVAILALALIGAGSLAGRGSEEEGARRLATLALLWTVLILGTELLAAARYDGVRHVLAVLPAMALLAASGVDTMARWLAALWRRGAWRRGVAAVGAGLGGGALLAVPFQLVALHPYHDAYLNEMVRWAHPAGNEQRFELEYWGATYKEGVDWLTRHGGEAPVLLVPFASWCAEPYVADRVELVRRFRLDSDPSRPHYLMLMTRSAWYTPTLERLAREGEPVYTVARQGSTLLQIHHLPSATLQEALWELRERHGRGVLRPVAAAGARCLPSVASLH